MTPLLELEGTWEEIAAHAPELAGRRVRLTVLTDDPEPMHHPSYRPPSTASSLLKYAGTWVGDDLKECLQAAINSRSGLRTYPAFDENSEDRKLSKRTRPSKQPPTQKVSKRTVRRS